MRPFSSDDFTRRPVRRGGLEAAFRREVETGIISLIADAGSEAVAKATAGTHEPVVRPAGGQRRTTHGCVRRVIRIPVLGRSLHCYIDFTLVQEDPS